MTTSIEEANMKRTPLRRVSKKRAALMREVGPERKAFLEEIGVCMVCRQNPPQDCHEIASGSAREDCLTEWDLIAVVCRKCHDKIQHWKPAKQIALVMAFRIDAACRRYCELKGFALTHVDRNAVLCALEYAKL
jgi:hypothetical protein